MLFVFLSISFRFMNRTIKMIWWRVQSINFERFTRRSSFLNGLRYRADSLHKPLPTRAPSHFYEQYVNGIEGKRCSCCALVFLEENTSTKSKFESLNHYLFRTTKF